VLQRAKGEAEAPSDSVPASANAIQRHALLLFDRSSRTGGSCPARFALIFDEGEDVPTTHDRSRARASATIDIAPEGSTLPN
jgi:hypothetical protein